MGNCISDPKYRIAECDIIRVILIIFVVIGHSGGGVLHDSIFLFHAYATQSLAKCYWIWKTNIYYNRCRNTNLGGDILWTVSFDEKAIRVAKIGK